MNSLRLTGSDGKSIIITLLPVNDGPAKVSLLRDGGEGGHFSEDELVEAIRQFMSERL